MSLAATISSDRELSVIEMDEHPVGADEVRVDVAFCGLCGSDLLIFFGAPEPLAGHIMGHEFSGVVREAGSGVSGWTAGDRVVVRPIKSCGACRECRGDDDAVCVTGIMGGPGLGCAGGLGDSVVVPAYMLHRVPDHLSLEHAALTEPLAVAVRGVRHAQVSSDDAVVITGAGPIGALTLEVLKAYGHERVLVVEPNAGRRAMAARRGALTAEPAGAAAAVAEHFPDGVAAIFDCTGRAECLQQNVDVAGYGARIVVLGIASTPAEVQPMAIALKEVVIVGSTGYSRNDFTGALDLLASGKVNGEALVTSVVDLGRADAKLRELHSGSTADIKVLVRHAGHANA
ncbi:zinc-dependent alcohol dehydrogenase [Mycolicibacterium pyrenivorans]|uniref:zinc-dependent alcohol dehydrogenase n=1 Tax=Mycolicibacterium pyrenivorans TaxID=187102 RepID=UPI0021F36043|nr:alcohol dehydrogenase catalytic domain-containing protein [Mycolicibacterium pyrenivorans]